MKLLHKAKANVDYKDENGIHHSKKKIFKNIKKRK
jgi:hypothetical protein